MINTDRDSIVRVNRISQFFSRVCASVCVFVSIPIVVKSFGEFEYGIWITITSVVSLFIWADCGLGSGLVTSLARADAVDDKALAGRIFSTTFWLVAVISALFLTVLSIVLCTIDLRQLLGVDNALVATVKSSLIILFILFFTTIPISLVDRVRTAYQQNFISAIFQVSSSVIVVISYYICSNLKLDMRWFMLAMFGPPLLANLINLVLLVSKYSWLRPKYRYLDLSMVNELGRVGGAFLLLYLFQSFICGMDNFIIAKFYGAESVAAFSVHSRLATIPNVMAMIFIAPLWGTYSNAMVKKDYDWMRKSITKVFFVIIAVYLTSYAALLWRVDEIVKMWVGGGISGSVSLAMVNLTWSLLMVLNALSSIFLNAVGVVKIQALWAGLTLIFIFGAKIYIAQSHGLLFVLWSGIVIYFLMTVFPLFLYIYRKYPEVFIENDQQA